VDFQLFNSWWVEIQSPGSVTAETQKQRGVKMRWAVIPTAAAEGQKIEQIYPIEQAKNMSLSSGWYSIAKVQCQAKDIPITTNIEKSSYENEHKI
jgi:hypothetical protein